MWPLLIWSAMGAREARQGTGQLVFSTPHPLRRQLIACWLSGFLVADLTGSGTALHLLFARNVVLLVTWLVGALFIPTLALALAVWSQSSKLFEVAYMLLWYVGPASRVAAFDFMGVTQSSSATHTSFAFLIAPPRWPGLPCGVADASFPSEAF